MFNIKVLDCTLRDGGYVNDWNFGKKSILKIIDNLIKTNVNYIEIGFLENTDNDNNKSLYNNTFIVENLIKNINKKNTKIAVMLNFKDYTEDLIYPKTHDAKLDTIRISFKKHEIENVIEKADEIKKMGYEIFLNPTNIETYSKTELIELIKLINNLKPNTFAIVDTNGVLKENSLNEIFKIVNHNLNKNISLCFHSHNNLQLSFSNAQCLMKICKDRELIIDSTVFGMGRGAGNLCTELLTQYINDHYDGNYAIVPILKIIDEEINPIFAKTPWGYSVPYYLAAVNHCHPNYAKYLADKQTIPVEIINNLLKSIPKEQKSTYNKELIKQIYLDNFSNIIDDNKTVEKIKNALQNKNILILAPGATIIKEKDKIKAFIEKHYPYIISLNFTHKDFCEDMAFVTNLKRFNSLDECKKMLVVTSNIKNPNTEHILNYSSYINDSKIFDNIALMLLKLLAKIGIKEVNFAGLDGFSEKPTENYVADELLMTKGIKQIKCTNKLLKENVALYRNEMKINFVTSTLLD